MAVIRRASKSARFSRSIPSIKPKRIVPDKKVVKKPTVVKKVTKATTFKKTTPPTVKPIVPKKVTAIRKASKATATIRLPGKKTPSKVVRVVKPVVKPITTTKRPTKTVQKIVAPVVAVNINPKSKPVKTVPLIPGIPGFVSGLPLVAGSVSPIPFQEDTPVSAGEQAFKLEGYKGTGQGFKVGGGGAEKEREKALDLTPVVLSEEPGEIFTEVIPSTAKPTSETRTFIDPSTGLLTEETKTTTPGDTVVTTIKGGVQEIGPSEIKSDFSDPIGSLLSGASQSALNEVIGVKNIGALAQGKEQEEFFATPSAILFGGAIDAGTSFFGDIGGAIFDIGRQAAGKKKVEIGQSVTSFGIAGDQVTIQQKARKKDATKILTESGERFGRVVQADPLFAVGDFAVQGALLAVAPVKAASLAIRGIGAVGKVATKVSGKAGLAGKLSFTGEKVTRLKPKTPISSTFTDEFAAFEQRAPQLAAIQDVSKLSTKERKLLSASQRKQFEVGVGDLQSGRGIGRIGEKTAEITPRPRSVSGFESTVFELGGAKRTGLAGLVKTTPKNVPGGLERFRSILGADVISKRTGAEIVQTRPFKTTELSLGKGTGKLVSGGDDFNFGGTGKGGKGGPDIFGGSGAGDTVGPASRAKLGGFIKATDPDSPFGKAFARVDDKAKKVSKADIDKFSKEAKVSKKEAARLIKDQETRGGTKAVQILLTKPKVVQAAKQNIFELEKAREALKKSKPSKAISSIANQKTQKRLSELIKQEKAKKPSTKADVATQKALKKLIAEEKAKVGGVTRLSSKVDNLFSAPRKTRGIATEADTIFRKPGTKLGIIGGIGSGLAIGAGLGLGQGLGNEQLFDQKLTTVKDPTIRITRNIFEPPSVIQKQDTVQKSIFEIPFQRTTQKQTPRLVTTIFQTPRTRITQKQQAVTERIDQPLQQITTTTFQPPPGVPGGVGFPFEGSRKDELKETKSQRRFFRVFDIAKTPFGRIDVGLGAQRQSDKPIFEFLEEDEPGRKAKSRPKNLGEEFFSI